MTSGEGGKTPSLLTLNDVVVAVVVVVVLAFVVVFVLLSFHDVGGCSAVTSWEGESPSLFVLMMMTRKILLLLLIYDCCFCFCLLCPL